MLAHCPHHDEHSTAIRCTQTFVPCFSLVRLIFQIQRTIVVPSQVADICVVPVETQFAFCHILGYMLRIYAVNTARYAVNASRRDATACGERTEIPGNSRRKRVPWSSVLSTSMMPLCSCTMP